MVDDIEYIPDAGNEGICFAEKSGDRTMDDLSPLEIAYLDEVKDNDVAYESRLELHTGI